jgi:hypothetical protein
MNELLSPLRTIRQHCLECGGTSNEVRLCPCINCRLYPYRLGCDPRRAKKVLSGEEREKIGRRFARKKTPLDKGEIHEGLDTEGSSGHVKTQRIEHE